MIQSLVYPDLTKPNVNRILVNLIYFDPIGYREFILTSRQTSTIRMRRLTRSWAYLWRVSYWRDHEHTYFLGSYLLLTIWQLKTYLSACFYFVRWVTRFSKPEYVPMHAHSPMALSPREPELSFIWYWHRINIKS
jgi:hypothetical protein